jgi:hypothetical protein
MMLSRHPFDDDSAHIGRLAGVLEGDGADVPLCIESDQRALIELIRPDDAILTEAI